MNTLRTLTVLGLLFLHCTFAHSAPAPACNIVRAANATISVNKYYWEQDSGVWVHKYVEIARAASDVPVVEDAQDACHFASLLTLDSMVVNGQALAIKFYAHIHVLTTGSTPNKVFTANYVVENQNGRSGYADSYTPDLTTKGMGLNLSNESDSASSVTHEETFEITVWFYDDGASIPVAKVL